MNTARYIKFPISVRKGRERGPFLERPGNYSGSKANFEIKTIVVKFLADKPLNFASLTDNFIVSFSKLLKL